jgi:hypothetical protein
MRQFSNLPPDDGSRRFQQCPPSHQEMALSPHHAQASVWVPRPSHPPTSSPVLAEQVSPYHQQGSTMPLAAPAANSSCHLVQFASMGGEYLRAGLHDRSYGSMAPLLSSSFAGLSTPSYSPHHLKRMGGGYSPTARTTTPSVRMTPSSHPTAIIEWAAPASVYAVYEYAHEILEYWDANASPHKQTICNEENAGPPLSLRLPIRERLLANEQSEVRCAKWVCTYLAMSVSPSHPHHHMGGGMGMMAPSPTIPPQVSSPSPSKANPPTPAHLTKTTSQLLMQSPSSPSPEILKRGGASLAEHRAATVLQCWKRCIWLCRWFNQQATLKQKRLRLQALCRGALAYASLVWGYRRPPPTPTKKTSDPKVLRHPFHTRGQPLPPRKRGGQHKQLRCCPG